MKKLTVGLMAHVDAGKTTLAESLLYTAGEIRTPGRVDRGDTVMDTHELERRRGITIFTGTAGLSWNGARLTLLDTPGNIDFSACYGENIRVVTRIIPCENNVHFC